MSTRSFFAELAAIAILASACDVGLGSTATSGSAWANVRPQRSTNTDGEIRDWLAVGDSIVAVGLASRAGETVAPVAWVIR